ncbi:Serine/threonine-protein kinase ATM [Quillaja saponaria]|uniref:Serine/threonine-protein kinase ATM n=1 Tax=Quillaja saponaria TaxID=32244 RepID=A0AAD7PX76_QUISA|nr:Serine/threonine-protein kinase ATM [Quillaja saponaria]
MVTVESRTKTPTGDSSALSEQDKHRDPEEKKKLKEAIRGLDGGHGGSNGSVEGARENGVRVSISGKEGFDNDDGEVVALTKVVETEITVESSLRGQAIDVPAVGDAHGLAASEMNGVSSLLKMRGSLREVEISYGGGSESSEKLDSVFVSEKTVAAADGSGGGNVTSLAGSIPGYTSEAGEDKRNDLVRKSEVDGNGDSLGENSEDPDAKIVTGDVPIMETSENVEEEVEDITNEGYGFCVGDFVWGKIKSHPWWPGRIYDPSDASDHAVKLRQKNRLLVAYFGDGSFAWCHRSQLKPLEENFKEMVKQSNLTAFVKSVEDAVDEVGRLVDLKMICPCVASDLGRPLAKNSGIKKGVFIPVTGLGKLSDILFDTRELLSRVKQIAEFIAISNFLELEILKGYLSAFYQSKGDYQLPVYQVAQPIAGLEDNSIAVVVGTNNGERAVDVPVQGPFEENYFSLPGSPNIVDISETMSQKCPRVSEDGVHHRRKQKSIAEIMGEDKDAHPKSKEGGVVEELRSAHKLTSSGKNKRKSSEESNALGGNGMTPKPGRRTKKELPKPPSSSLSNVSSAEGDSNGEQEDTEKIQSLKTKKKKKNIGSKTNSNGSKLVTDDEDKEQTEKVSLARERKRSKYLSPPFTSIETESLKVASEAQLQEQVTKAASHLIGSTPLVMCGTEASQENLPKELNMDYEPSVSLSSHIPDEDEYKIIDPLNVKASVAEVIAEVRSAAVGPKEISETVWAFMSVVRNSIYRDGSNYKVYRKRQPDRERKKLGPLKNNGNQINDKSSNYESEPKKRRKNKKDNPELPKQQQLADFKTSCMAIDEQSSSAALFVTFGPGSFLPSRADLITIYSKFGALNETETDMFYNNFVARVSFMRSSDAEGAYNQSQNCSPFGYSNVTFRLRYLSAESRTRELNEVPLSETSHLPKVGDKAPGKPSVSQLNFVKHKLKMMTSMLEASGDKTWPDIKTLLESEMKGLLEKVNTMVESSSS